MVLPQLGQRKAIVDPAEKAGRLVWIRRDGHLRGSLRIFTDDDFHVAVEVVGRHDQIQWRGHALVDATRQIEQTEEHTSALQSLMRISYADFCLHKQKSALHT